MSLSLLYHALGLYGFHQLRSWQKGGALYLEVVRSKKPLRGLQHMGCEEKRLSMEGNSTLTHRKETRICSSEDEAVLL